MRYAGVEITPEKRPQHLESMVLSEADQAKVRQWYEAVPLPAAPKRKNC
ncbi:MAG: DUF3744 domain-containing protein [Lachnospiraceae bacterium]